MCLCFFHSVSGHQLGVLSLGLQAYHRRTHLLLISNTALGFDLVSASVRQTSITHDTPQLSLVDTFHSHQH